MAEFELSNALPIHLANRYEMWGERPPVANDLLLLDRFYRAIFCDRARMYLGTVGETRARDQAAKRKVLAAMAFCATKLLKTPVIELAEELDERREHLYRDAQEVAAAFEKYVTKDGQLVLDEDTGQPLGDWRWLPELMALEEVWPYDSNFTIEVLGDDDGQLTREWPVPMFEGKQEGVTTYFPARLANPNLNIVQVAVNQKGTRPGAIEIRTTEAGFVCGKATLTALDVLQRALEVHQMLMELADLDDEEGTWQTSAA